MAKEIRKEVETPTSAETDPKPAQGVAAPREAGTKSLDEVLHFDHTITKVDEDGNEVLSDHLAPGEKIRHGDEVETFDDIKKAREDAAEDVKNNE